ISIHREFAGVGRKSFHGLQLPAGRIWLQMTRMPDSVMPKKYAPTPPPPCVAAIFLSLFFPGMLFQSCCHADQLPPGEFCHVDQSFSFMSSAQNCVRPSFTCEAASSYTCFG